ncbi:MAG: hypothetical protein Q4A05_00225 [Ruminococcus sp.]|nr:hypothetical protein [Ruminococcus sp.]
MKRLTALLAAVAAAGVIAVGCSSGSNDSNEPVPRVKTVSVDDIARLNGGQMPPTSYYYDTDRVREIEGKVSSTPVNNKDDALTVIRELADIIGCDDPQGELRYSETNPCDGGFNYVFEQYYRDVPVRRGSVSIAADEDGNTTRLYNSYIENVNIATEPKISADDAVKLAKRKYSCDTRDEPELIIIETGRNSIYLTWDAKLDRSNYPDEAFIDAQSGTVLVEDGPVED